MARKEFTYRGKSVEELKKLSLNELAVLFTSRARRKIKRGFSDREKKLMAGLQKKNSVETHCRDMLVLPEMLGKTIKIHNGKEFVPVMIQDEMIGHYLGEFALTRRKVAHSAPGIGATKSSANVSAR